MLLISIQYLKYCQNEVMSVCSFAQNKRNWKPLLKKNRFIRGIPIFMDFVGLEGP